MSGKSRRRQTERQRKRADRLKKIAQDIEINAADGSRTEVLVTARAMAMAGLPKRKTSKRDLSRTLRLGTNLWLRVTYSTKKGGTLPYGSDRFVLAGIQHFARVQQSRIVLFDHVTHLLKYFGLDSGGLQLKRLRDRFERLAGLAIHLEFAETRDGLEKATRGQQTFVIDEYALPTREEVRCAKIGKTALPRLVANESKQVQYGVILSEYFWKHLQEESNQLLLHLDMMREFMDKPTGWDYASYITGRCLRARSWSIVPHETLMSLFKDNPNEYDSQTIKRLQRYHADVMKGTGGRLKAVLEQDGFFPRSPKGGHRKARWVLRIGPSKDIIWSGKKNVSV